ncbi:hypothetical protein [Rathayibacter rathayi]|uniref:hypothetical protein n=1 Tax=Rathayibacter rathayi TaxID=33887 RepID=UPI000CE80381|nr:hypothetical protein [Rathayibacter rathayi]PPG85008.1 hypothetical protein C5C47_14095 [Rathayibacter rathayi]
MSAKRPTTDQQLIEELRSLAGEWVAIYVYPSQDIGAARVMASDIRRGRRKHLAGLGGLETRTRPNGDTVVVEARTRP